MKKYLGIISGLFSLTLAILVLFLAPIVAIAISIGGAFLGAAAKFFLDQRSVRWDKKRKELSRTLSSSYYLEWQKNILERIYDGLEIVEVFKQRYPATIIRTRSGREYPFENLCELTNTDVPVFPLDKNQKAYINILGPSLKWPAMKGFALKKIIVDSVDSVLRIEATTATFLQNIVTSHILEWELVNYYKKSRGNIPDRTLPKEDILRHLPRRSLYHDNRSVKEVVLNPSSAYPLISLQAMVIFREMINQPATWKILIARRSEEVVIKPGQFQFQPAGGFEVYGSEKDDELYLVERGFDISAALLREYAEELFDARDLQSNPDGHEPSSIFANPNVYALRQLMESDKAFIDFLGIVIDLTTLRHELSFLIIVDDKSLFESALKGSWESKHIAAITPCKLQSVIKEGVLHGSSAGLLQLALESERLKELGISAEILQ